MPSGRGTLLYVISQHLASRSWQSPLVRSVPERDCHEFFQGPVSNAQFMERPTPLIATSTHYPVRHSLASTALPLLPVSGDPCLPLVSHTGEDRIPESRAPS
jgi:hypothetical protein